MRGIPSRKKKHQKQKLLRLCYKTQVVVIIQSIMSRKLQLSYHCCETNTNTCRPLSRQQFLATHTFRSSFSTSHSNSSIGGDQETRLENCGFCSPILFSCFVLQRTVDALAKSKRHAKDCFHAFLAGQTCLLLYKAVALSKRIINAQYREVFFRLRCKEK